MLVFGTDLPKIIPKKIEEIWKTSIYTNVKTNLIGRNYWGKIRIQRQTHYAKLLSFANIEEIYRPVVFSER